MLRALGVTCFFNIVALGGGGWVIKFLIIKTKKGGHKNTAEVLSEIHDPPIPKKMVALLVRITTFHIISQSKNAAMLILRLWHKPESSLQLISSIHHTV